MSLDSLPNVLTHEMSDLLSAENQFAKLLQQVAKNADSPEVKEMAETHHAETLQHIENLKQAIAALGKKPGKIVCKAAKGIVEENVSTLQEEKPKGVFKDMALISGGLRVEHYEIAGYRSAITTARAVGNKQVVTLLQANLKQEEATGKKLEAAAAVKSKLAAAAPAPEAASAPAKKPATKKPAAKTS